MGDGVGNAFRSSAAASLRAAALSAATVPRRLAQCHCGGASVYTPFLQPALTCAYDKLTVCTCTFNGV